MNKCQTPMPMSVDEVGTTGYISSFVTQKTSCGDTDNPWLITADVGQRINVTLIDFVSTLASDNGSPKENFECDVYATIREENGAVTNTVCGGQKRKTVPVFLSTSNSVEIKLVGRSIQQGNSEGHFLLQYTSKITIQYAKFNNYC